MDIATFVNLLCQTLGQETILFRTVWVPIVILVLFVPRLVNLLPLLHDLVILIGRIVVVISLGPLIIVVGMLPVVVGWCISLILLIIVPCYRCGWQHCDEQQSGYHSYCFLHDSPSLLDS